MKADTTKLRSGAMAILSVWQRRAQSSADKFGPPDDLWTAAIWSQSVLDALAEGWVRAAEEDMQRARAALDRALQAANLRSAS